MLRWTFPYLLFVSLAALAGGILNSYQRFVAAAFSPVVLNVVLIVFAVWVAPLYDRPGMALAAGVFAAGVVQLAVHAAVPGPDPSPAAARPGAGSIPASARS